MQRSGSGLENKVALVTGSAARIGAHFIRRLHAAGADVVIHYRNSAEAALQLQSELEAQRPLSSCVVEADLCRPDSLRKLVQQAIEFRSRLDILVNNASSFYPTAVGNTTEEDWDDLLCSNLKAPYFLVQAARDALRQNSGVVINMVDIHGQNPHPGHAVYCSAKAGLIMLTRALAKELAPEIRVNGIAPGSILWPEGDAALTAQQQQQILAGIALQRQGSANDLGDMLMFLVSEQAGYVTGQIIAVDGGRAP